ncbi:MAG: SIR2 family NAD-dependent protein deacylase [Solirubrobacterales bacterium]
MEGQVAPGGSVGEGADSPAPETILPAAKRTGVSFAGEPAPSSREVDELASLLIKSRSTVVLTGAGISVPSGIPDFRSPGTGIWENIDPFEVATIEAFHRDTKRFWEFDRPRFEMLGEKQPNRAHDALAELERRGLVEAVITQNVDRLHHRAGSERVIEVHGSIGSSSCLTCGASWPLEQVEALFDEDGVASCSGCMGKVKPDVVLFGEMLPEAAMTDARELAAGAELMLCVGSSLEVYPVAGLPELTLSAGGKLVVLTKGPTPYDGEADVRMHGDVVEELSAVLAAL